MIHFLAFWGRLPAEPVPGAESAVAAAVAWVPEMAEVLAVVTMLESEMVPTARAQVSPRPRTLYAPDPEYSDEARKAKFQGTVLLWLVVGRDGRPRDVRIVRSVGMGLDEKALAVRTWRFDPGHKDGQPVATQIHVEVSFRLY